MRKSDKTKNIIKANLLTEQRFVETNSLTRVNENVDRSNPVYQYLTNLGFDNENNPKNTQGTLKYLDGIFSQNNLKPYQGDKEEYKNAYFWLDLTKDANLPTVMGIKTVNNSFKINELVIQYLSSKILDENGKKLTFQQTSDLVKTYFNSKFTLKDIIFDKMGTIHISSFNKGAEQQGEQPMNEDIGSPIKDLYSELGYMKKNNYKTSQTSDLFSVGDNVKNSTGKNGQVIELLLGPNGEKIVYVKYDLEDSKPVTVRYNGDEIKDLSK